MKRKWTMRKYMLLVFGVFALAGTVASYALAFLGMETASDLTLYLLGLFDAAYIAYLGADCLDHNSLNRYGGHKQNNDDEEGGALG